VESAGSFQKLGREFRAKCLQGFGLARMWRARARGQKFVCEALSGRSEYNISINADMTVSCNCNDQDGAGQLGDLDSHSFGEIFSGPVGLPAFEAN
jgi:hypothetical protein